jgi:hypothetical protein
MAKADLGGPLNVLALRGVDLANLINHSPVTDDKGQPFRTTPAAISNWATQSNCPRNRDGTYNAIHVMTWALKERAQTPYRPRGGLDEMEKAKLADKLEQTRARRQARLAAAKKLIDREDVVADWMLLLHSFRAGLTTLTRVLVKEVVGQPEAVVKAKLEERINDVLKSFAEGWDGAGDIPKGEGQ